MNKCEIYQMADCWRLTDWVLSIDVTAMASGVPTKRTKEVEDPWYAPGVNHVLPTKAARKPVATSPTLPPVAHIGPSLSGPTSGDSREEGNITPITSRSDKVGFGNISLLPVGGGRRRRVGNRKTDSPVGDSLVMTRCNPPPPPKKKAE